MASGTYHLNMNEDDAQNDEHILPKGTVLDKGRYEILRILGLGGMGSVYLARDLRFRDITRHCAIKEMTIHSPDPGFRRLAMDNFKREANTLASLAHQSIVKIFDFFSEENRVYLVMEYIDGIDLDEVITSLPDNEYLEEDRVLRWGIQICDILTFLHSQGDKGQPIVYRDLKPPNLILRKDGSDSLVLIDFGIAKAFQEGQKGTMMGTEGYSPPEQYKGEASPQGDVYALGATLHHLLTRRDPKLEPPFSFHEAPPRQLIPTISEATDAAIMKSLNYNKDDRYATAAEMKIALEDALRNKAVTPSANQTTSPNLGGSQPLTASTTVLQPPTTPNTAAPTTFLPQQPGHTEVLPQQPGQPLPQMPQQPPMQQPGAYPPQQQQYQQQQYPPQQQPYQQQQYPHPQQPYQQPSPGMPMQAPGFINNESDVVPIWTFKAEDEVRSSPSLGHGLVYFGVYDNNVYALDAASGKFRWKYPTEGGIASSPCVAEDRLLFGSEDQSVYAISSHLGKLLWTCQTEGKIRSSIHVEFGHAFFGSDDGKLYAANIQSGRVVWRFEAGGAIQSTPIVDGELVYVGCEDGHLYALDLQTGKMKWKFRTSRGIISSPAIQGDLVLFGSKDRTFYALDKTSGWSIWKYTTGQAIYSSPYIVGENVYFGSVDTNVYSLDVETGRVNWKFKADSPVTSRPAVSDDAVYFGTSNGEVMSVEVKNGQKRWQFKSGGPVPSSPVLGDGVIYIGSTDHNVYALPA